MKALITLALVTMVSGLSLAQTPSAPPTATPAPATPPAPAALSDEAAITATLGPLANHLVAAISMDNEANGSLVVSRPPAPGQAIFSLKKRFLKDEGRQCASFAEPGTTLGLYSINLGTSWTLAIWAKLPFTGDEAVIWQGGWSQMLCVRDNKFKSIEKNADHTYGECDKSWTGWHHIALTSDQTTMTLYIDGTPYAQATEMDTIEGLTNDFITFIKDVADDSRVIRGKHTNPAIRTRIDAWLSSKSRQLSARDASNVDQNFISFLKVASQTDVTARDV